MTIIDALVVELGLDSGDLEKKAPVSVAALKKLEGQGDKTEKSVKKISSTSKETARSVSDLSRVVSSFLAVIGGTVAIKAFISDFIETNAQLDRLSKNLGVSVSTISAWSNASEKLGGSAQGLQGTFDMLSKSQTQLMLTGESNLIPYLSALGISLADTEGKARPVTDILLDLADKFSKMDRTQANNFGRMMGIDQGTMNLLLQGRKELELEIRRQKEQAAVTKQQAEEASKLQTKIVGIKQTFASLGRTLLMDAAPTLERVFGYLQKFGDWAIANKDFIEDFLKVLAVGLGAIALASAPIDLTVTAVLALAAGIALLWQDYQTWKKGGDSLINWAAWKPEIDSAIEAVNTLTTGIKILYSAAKALHDLIPDSWARGLKNWTESHFNTDSSRANRLQQILRPTSRNQLPGGTTNADEIKAYFVKQGWTPAQAAGIAANLMTESQGNTQATGDSGLAFGLAQWHPDRQADFKAFSGKDIRDASVMDQLAFVQFELTRGNRKAAGDALKNATSAQRAGEIVSRQYEAPKDVEGEASRRGSYAQQLFGISGASAFSGNAPGGSGSGQSNVDRSVKTTIDTINVQTQATDAQGIARDLGHSLDFLFASQANTGLN